MPTIQQSEFALSIQLGGDATPRPWDNRFGERSPSLNLGWLRVFSKCWGHDTYLLEQSVDGQASAVLPLVHMRSLIFGRFLVSMPYLNVGGCLLYTSPSPRDLSTSRMPSSA